MVVEGMEKMTLVNTGPEFFTLTEGLCLEFWLVFLPIGGLLHPDGMGVFQFHASDTLRLTILYHLLCKVVGQYTYLFHA